MFDQKIRILTQRLKLRRYFVSIALVISNSQLRPWEVLLLNF